MREQELVAVGLSASCLVIAIVAILYGWWKDRKDQRRAQYDVETAFLRRPWGLVAKYPTLADAIRGSQIMSIRKCLIGERRQAGGYKWAYQSSDLVEF